jgi:Telomere resolvase
VNTYFLKNGQNFIVNPSLESDPVTARESKKTYLLGLNTVDLTTDKVWSAEAVRKLAISLVEVSNGKGGYLSKKVLIDRLVEFAVEERRALTIRLDDGIDLLRTELKTISFDYDRAKLFIETLTGQALATALVNLSLSFNYAPSTVTKTLTPRIIKLVDALYKGDAVVVKRGIYDAFAQLNKEVNKVTYDKVSDKCLDRAITDWQPLSEAVQEILDRVETAHWKELSFAISVATGRRQSEVHGIETVFEVVDDRTLTFSGQLKTKSRGQVPSYRIPCLFDSKTVLRAWERLREEGKVFSPSECHSKLSKALSTELPQNIKAIKVKANLVAYKDSRDLYGAYCLKVFRTENVSTNAYLATVMGHGEGDLGTATTYDKRGVFI